jgi:hypothetical protein
MKPYLLFSQEQFILWMLCGPPMTDNNQDTTAVQPVAIFYAWFYQGHVRYKLYYLKSVKGVRTPNHQ